MRGATRTLRLLAGTRWRSWLALVLLGGIIGGAGVAAGVTARRTATAVPRMLTTLRAADAAVSADETRPGGIPVARRYLDAADRLPPVAFTAREGAVDLGVVHDGHLDQRFVTGTALGVAAESAGLFRTFDALRVESGRLADTRQPDEMTINPELARVSGWRVGDTVRDLSLFPHAAHDKYGDVIVAKRVPLTLHVVGITRSSDELLLPPAKRPLRAYLSQAFLLAHPEATFYEVDLMRLRGPTALAELRTDVDRIVGGYPGITPFISSTRDGVASVQRTLRPQQSVLWVICAVALLAAAVVIGQGTALRFDAMSTELRVLRATGLTRRQRTSVGLLAAGAVGGAACVLALVVGWLLTPLGPVGAAGAVEPNPGLYFDSTVSLLLVAALLVAVGLITVVPTVRISRRAEAPAGAVESVRSPAAARLAGWGAPTPAVIGARFALDDGGGRHATRQRTALVGIWLAVLLATAAALFAVNLHALTSSPGRYGWTWDVAAGTEFGTVPTPALKQIVYRDPVRSAAGVTFGTAHINGHTVAGMGFAQLRGDPVFLTVVAGRRPVTRDEIALGGTTMRVVHARLGDVLPVRAHGRLLHLRVVGQVTFPAFGNVRFEDTALGRGIVGLADLFPQDPTTGGKYNYVVLNVRPGGVPVLRARLAKVGCADASCLLADARPTELGGYAQARTETVGVVGLLAFAFLVVVTHTVVTAARRRRAEVALLKALGMTRRDVTATMMCLAAILTVAACVVGIPLGIIAGHYSWVRFTDQLGVPAGSVVAWSVVGAAVAGVVALTALPSAVSTVIARRTSIARELRATD